MGDVAGREDRVLRLLGLHSLSPAVNKNAREARKRTLLAAREEINERLHSGSSEPDQVDPHLMVALVKRSIAADERRLERLKRSLHEEQQELAFHFPSTEATTTTATTTTPDKTKMPRAVRELLLEKEHKQGKQQESQDPPRPPDEPRPLTLKKKQ